MESQLKEFDTDMQSAARQLSSHLIPDGAPG